MAGNFDQVTKVYEEAHEAHILMEFEKLVLKHGVDKVMKQLGEETQWAIIRYFGCLS